MVSEKPGMKLKEVRLWGWAGLENSASSKTTMRIAMYLDVVIASR